METSGESAHILEKQCVFPPPEHESSLHVWNAFGMIAYYFPVVHVHNVFKELSKHCGTLLLCTRVSVQLCVSHV